MSRTAISFYWRNDTPSFVTWRSRLATAPDTPTCIVMHGGKFTCGVHPPNQFVPEIVSPLPCSPALVHHTLLIVYFFKELISFIGSLDKYNTSVLNALIFSLLQTDLLGIRHVVFDSIITTVVFSTLYQTTKFSSGLNWKSLLMTNLW